MNLRTPGPTPVPQDILEAMSGPMINHRGPEFKELLFRVTTGLKQAFETGNDVFILASSGTGAMEAAIVNILSPGDRVLCTSAGAFGDRFGQIADAFGAEVVRLSTPLGTAVDPAEVRMALKRAPDIKAVLVTHNETSTGVTNHLESIAEVVKNEFDKLLVVDAVSSQCSIPLRTDAWRCDVVASASQKGWMLPPGLGFISFSERAWEAQAQARMPRFYFDLSAYKHSFEMGQTPYTPNLSAMFALDLILGKVLAEGMDAIFRRHIKLGQMTRDGVRGLGLSVFPDERVASNTVTAVNVPEGVDGQCLLTLMREEHGVVLAGGLQSLRGKIFRIGHMGHCTPEEIQGMLNALETVLLKVGFTPSKVGAAGR